MREAMLLVKQFLSYAKDDMSCLEMMLHAVDEALNHTRAFNAKRKTYVITSFYPLVSSSSKGRRNSLISRKVSTRKKSNRRSPPSASGRKIGGISSAPDMTLGHSPGESKFGSVERSDSTSSTTSVSSSASANSESFRNLTTLNRTISSGRRTTRADLWMLSPRDDNRTSSILGKLLTKTWLRRIYFKRSKSGVERRIKSDFSAQSTNQGSLRNLISMGKSFLMPSRHGAMPSRETFKQRRATSRVEPTPGTDRIKMRSKLDSSATSSISESDGSEAVESAGFSIVVPPREKERLLVQAKRAIMHRILELDPDYGKAERKLPFVIKMVLCRTCVNKKKRKPSSSR